MNDLNVDRWLAWCEDRYMQATDEVDDQILDEYGRPMDHPDYGYVGPSIDYCANCNWSGDSLEYGYFCPNCGNKTIANE